MTSNLKDKAVTSLLEAGHTGFLSNSQWATHINNILMN